TMHQPQRIGLLRCVEHLRRQQGIAWRLVAKVNHQVQIGRARYLAMPRPAGRCVVFNHVDPRDPPRPTNGNASRYAPPLPCTKVADKRGRTSAEVRAMGTDPDILRRGIHWTRKTYFGRSGQTSWRVTPAPASSASP